MSKAKVEHKYAIEFLTPDNINTRFLGDDGQAWVTIDDPTILFWDTEEEAKTAGDNWFDNSFEYGTDWIVDRHPVVVE